MKQRKLQFWESPAVQLPCLKISVTSIDTTSTKRSEHGNRMSPNTPKGRVSGLSSDSGPMYHSLQTYIDLIRMDDVFEIPTGEGAAQ